MKSKVEHIKKDLIMKLVEVGVLDKALLENMADGKLNNDLEDIYSFKILGFTDDEIMSIFIFKKLAQLSNEDWQIYKNLFYKNKSDRITYRIKSLQEINDKLIKSIKDIKPVKHKSRLGVSISSLKYLKCNMCDGELLLNNGIINKNHILSGTLVCNNCGEEYKIQEGIIFIGEKKEIEIDCCEEIVTKYITNSTTEELLNMNNAVGWVSKKLPENLGNFTILEVGSGLGLLLRQVYSRMGDDSTYIAVNDNIHEHYFIKQIIERSNTSKNILFICANYDNLPLVTKCADVILDISGHIQYNASKTSNIVLLNDYVKENSVFIASYLLLNRVTSNSDEDKTYFMLDNLKEEIKNQGYSIIKERLIGIKNRRMIKNLDKNTKLYNYMFLGEHMDLEER